MREATVNFVRAMRDMARAMGPEGIVETRCGADHPLVPAVSCTRRFNHRGMHSAPAPPGGPSKRLRWEQ